jgi:SsrA-binding protein
VQQNINIVNKKAKFKYFLNKKYIAGLVLNGSEIKSIRLKNVNLESSYCSFNNDELYVNNIIIKPYENSSQFNKIELNKLKKEINNVGVTIIPYKIFINEKGIAKIEIYTSKGKKNFDKREVIKKRENKINLDRLKKNL